MRNSKVYEFFQVALKNMQAYLADAEGAPSEDAARLRVSAAQTAELTALWGAYEAAYRAYVDPARAAAQTAAMRRAHKAADAFARRLRAQIKHGEAEVLPADSVNLGIHQNRRTRTRAPRPRVAPFLSLREARHSVHRYVMKLPLPGGRQHTAMPHRMRLAREMAVLPAGVAPAAGDFRPLDTIGRARFNVIFSPEQTAMVAHLRGWLVSARGESGPKSDIVSTPIV